MKWIRKPKFSLILVVLVFSLFSFTNHFEMSKHLEIFVSVFKKLNEEYVDDVDSGELMRVGIDAMLESLDPYTVYYSESEIEDYKTSISGEYGGIGSMIRTDSNYVIITEPYENSPATKAGLIAGDKITFIDGNSTEGKNAGDISKLLKGTPGTDVNIKIDRPFVGPLEINLTREKIKLPSVPYYTMMEDGIAYIQLTQFTRKCGKEVQNAYAELAEKNDIKGVIFDLRSNPGGLLNEAVNVTNTFIPKGKEVVYTQGRDLESRKTYNTRHEPSNDSVPLVVLINGRSASASEIVSGTIQDYDRGIVIGQRSYGKGLVQTTRPLVYNTQIKFTTAKYYIPSGRCIQELDYTNKDKKGKAKKFADSLRAEFKTANGRVVFDGRGVTPDYEAKDSSFSNVSVALRRKNIIFDFVTQYKSKNDSIVSIEEFEVTEEIFASFKDFIKGKDYSYKTKTEKILNDLEKNTKKESYYDALQTELESLRTKLDQDKANDVDKFKEEIKFLIKKEILTRYYYQKGKIAAGFDRDNYLKEALHILKNPEIYQSLFEVKVVGENE